MGPVISWIHLSTSRWRAELLGRERPLQLAQDRPAAAHRDPEVVEELGVVVGQGAGHVGLDHAGQVARARARRPCRCDRRVGSATRTLVRMPPGSPPDAATASSAMVDGGSTSPPSVASSPTTARQRARVAQHPGDLEPGGERAGLGPGIQRGVGGEAQADDGLGVAVEHAQRLDVDLDPGQREQRPHLDDRAERGRAGAPWAGGRRASGDDAPLRRSAAASRPRRAGRARCPPARPRGPARDPRVRGDDRRCR